MCRARAEINGAYMVSIFSSRSSETSSYRARLEKMREEGCMRGAQEAGMFRLAAGKYYQPPQVHDWINQAIEEGRRELEAQHALEREIETWDLACRTMFLLMTIRDWSVRGTETS
jgi:hypothetical protein